MGAASVRKYTIDGRAARPFAAVVAHEEKHAIAKGGPKVCSAMVPVETCAYMR